MWPPKNVRVIRSAKRTRTASARLTQGVIEVRIPATFTPAQERETVKNLVARLERKTSSTPDTDALLRQRAERLNAHVLEGRARIGSIKWSSRQNTRWGSCTVATGDIRISDRLKDVPDYVVDAVIVHELAHTIVAGHTDAFWALAEQAPHAEKAAGYLEAYQRFGP